MVANGLAADVLYESPVPFGERLCSKRHPHRVAVATLSWARCPTPKGVIILVRLLMLLVSKLVDRVIKNVENR
jgi:hypothetical protein